MAKKAKQDYKIYVCTHKDPGDRLPKRNKHYQILTTEDVLKGENLGAMERAYAEGSHIYITCGKI